MCTLKSKQQEGSTYKDSHPKCFINRGEILRARFRHFLPCFYFNFYTSIKLMSFCAHVLLKYLNKAHFLTCKKWVEREPKIPYTQNIPSEMFQNDKFWQIPSRKESSTCVPNSSAKFRIWSRQYFGCMFRIYLQEFNSNMWKYSGLGIFWQRRKMFTERRVIERLLLERKGTLIFLVKYFKCSLKPQDNSTQLAATPELNVSRGAVKTFQFF